MIRFYFVLLFALFTSSCASEKKRIDMNDNVKSRSLYIHAINSIARNNYFDALHDLDQIQNDHAFTHYYKNAIILEVFAYYVTHQYERVDGTMEVFFRLYPNDHQNIRYLKYLNGLSEYEILKKKRLNDSVIEETRAFWSYLGENKAIYPKSIEQEIDLKLRILNDIESLYNLQVGDYYQSYKELYSAIIRYNEVLNGDGNDELKKIAREREYECHKMLGLE